VGTLVSFEGSQHMHRSISAVLTAALATTMATSAMAGGKWGQNHPRREQVNDRLQNQNRRINTELKEGEISKGQAHALHREDHQIRQEERDMASQNGGHITKAEQGVLNQQENKVSGQIGQ
jgi:hypothetical protein